MLRAPLVITVYSYDEKTYRVTEIKNNKTQLSYFLALSFLNDPDIEYDMISKSSHSLDKVGTHVRVVRTSKQFPKLLY